MAALVDSSVWIAAQKSTTTEFFHLKKMIQENESLYTCSFIQVEVSQGARTEELFHKIWDSFLGFPHLEMTEDIYIRSAIHYFQCRKKGLTLTTIDCLIATLAKYYDVPLWTLDKGLLKSHRVINFKIFEP